MFRVMVLLLSACFWSAPLSGQTFDFFAIDSGDVLYPLCDGVADFTVSIQLHEVVPGGGAPNPVTEVRVVLDFPDGSIDFNQVLTSLGMVTVTETPGQLVLFMPLPLPGTFFDTQTELFSLSFSTHLQGNESGTDISIDFATSTPLDTELASPAYVDPIKPTNVTNASLNASVDPSSSRAFRRGDVNGDGLITLLDVYDLSTYASSGGTPPCFDAADVNDNGLPDYLVDATYLFNYMFSQSSPPPSPFSMCGCDDTPDSLDCADYDFANCPP